MEPLIAHSKAELQAQLELWICGPGRLTFSRYIEYEGKIYRVGDHPGNPIYNWHYSIIINDTPVRCNDRNEVYLEENERNPSYISCLLHHFNNLY